MHFWINLYELDCLLQKINTNKIIKMSQPLLAWRLIGGKQLDFALKKVILSDYVSRSETLFWFWLLCLTGNSICRCFNWNSPYLRADSCFSGSMIDCKSRVLLMYSLRGESLKLRTFDEDMIISVVCSSWVEGNSSRNSFLPCLVAVVNFRVLYTGKASRLG